MTGPPRVLLIEDDAGDRARIRQCLADSRQSYELVEASDVATGLKAMARDGVDLVLLDHHVPGGTSFDVLDGMRVRGLACPVILLSGDEDTALVVSLMQAGAADFLPKDQLTPDRLRRSIQAALRISLAEQREQAARREGDRLLQQLAALLETSVVLHGFSSIEDTLNGCAQAGLTLLRGDGADASWTSQGQRAVGRAGRAREAGDEVCTATLPIMRRQFEGELSVYRPTPFDALDRLSLAWLAQTAAVALDNTQLLKSSVMATQVREDLLAIVSHDLRNPVAIVSAAAEELRATMPEAQKVAAVILRASRRMVRLLDDLLDAAQVDAGTLRVTATAQPLARLFEEARSGVDPHRVVTFSAVSPEVRVLADRDRVLQVFSNLIGNALKFTPTDGYVGVEHERQGDRVFIRVRDTGPGVPREQRPRLFERYWSGKTQPKSAGLGLYIARAVVAAHGGRLELEDTPRGATFRFDLKVAG